GLVQVIYLVARAPPGGTPLSGMPHAGPLIPETAHEDVMKRKLDTNSPFLRKVVQESASYTSVLTAVLLQLAQPGVGKGAGRHSRFRASHAERTLNTAIYLSVMAFGTDEEMIDFRNLVTFAHKHVNDKTTNQSYDAMDPKLLLWIAEVAYVTMIEKIQDHHWPVLRRRARSSLPTIRSIPHRPSSFTIHMSVKSFSFQQYWNRELARIRPPKEAIHIAQGLP
ncbi:hypothetical protein ACJ73_07254, partial [Blastomyces percursus]